MTQPKKEKWRVLFDREDLTRLDAAIDFIESTLSGAQMKAHGEVRSSPADGAMVALRNVLGLSWRDVLKCEGCGALILSGDRYCPGEDMDFGECCAPTYAQALADWRSLDAEALADAHGGAEALASCERAVAEGRGDEKPVRVFS